MVDRQSPVPLTYQLSENLRARILDGEYPPDTAIPTEEQLMAEHKVSRTTVRLALARLVNEGLIRREQGRGTYVNPPPHPAGGVHRLQRVARDMFEVKSTTHIVQSAGMQPRAEVLGLETELASPRIAELLDIAPGDPVWLIERLRYANEIPLVLEQVRLTQALCPGLTRDDVVGSLYRILSDRYGHQLSAAHQVLRAITVRGEQAQRLQVAEGTAAMLVQGVTYLADGRPVEVEHSIFNGEMMEFILDLGLYSQYARIRRTTAPTV